MNDENNVAINDEFKLELMEFDSETYEENLWKARTGLTEETLSGAIETIIFMSDKPLSIVKIKNLIDEDMSLRVIHDAISKLQMGYEQSYHGIRLVEVAEGYQFRTKASFAKYVQDLFKVNSLVLSPTSLEVLAIIAYKQPVSRVEIEKIRGVDSSHIVRTLMDKRLVKTMGRSEELGRPTLYGTTTEFLEVFNLASLESLPSEHELDSMAFSNSVGRIADIKSLVQMGDKEKFKFDEFHELESLSESIKNINPETSFTKSLSQNSVQNSVKISVDISNENENTPKRKTAFELLEDFVNIEMASKENQVAGTSDLPSGLVAPEVISDLTAGPYNLPNNELEDDFQMIDLDTGMPIPIEDTLKSHESHIDDIRQSMIDEANALDIDLDFLNHSNFTDVVDSGPQLD